MNSADPNIAFWREVTSMLRHAVETLPNGSEPDIKVHFDHPDEEWKNLAQKEELETSFRYDTYTFIKNFSTTSKWPGRFKRAIPFYVEQRLTWGYDFIRILITPSPEKAHLVFPAALISPREFVLWLLTDAYDRRKPQPNELPFKEESLMPEDRQK